MQKNVREIAVIMQDKEKEYKICEKLRRQPELRDLKILCREQLQSLGPSETFNKRLKRLQPLAGRVLLTDLQDTELPEVVKNIPKGEDYIKVSEAYALFGISRDTLYRLIRKETIRHINLGTNQIRVSKSELMKLYPLRKKTSEKPRAITKLYSLEPKDCYTIGEISEKYRIHESSVYQHIRKFSIPTRQIGNYVYVPKKEIDNLYKGEKK